MSYARNLARLARTGIITVDTAQDLRDLAIYSGIRPDAVQTLGATTKNDGGGGQWYWDGTDTSADNLGTVIKEATTTTGRWKRQYSGVVNVKWFGASGDGVSDDTANLNNAFQSGSVFIPEGTYSVNSPLTVSGSIRNFVGDGCHREIDLSFTGSVIKAPGQITGPMLTFETPSPGDFILGTRLFDFGIIANSDTSVILLKDCSKVTLDTVYVRGSRDYPVGIDLTEGSFFVTFNKVNVINFSQIGILVRGIGSQHVFRDCVVESSDLAGTVTSPEVGLEIRQHDFIVDGGQYNINSDTGIGILVTNDSSETPLSSGEIRRTIHEYGNAIKIDTQAGAQVTKNIIIREPHITNIVKGVIFGNCAFCHLIDPQPTASSGTLILAEWEAESDSCLVRGNYNVGRSNFIVDPAARNAVLHVTGRIAYGDRSNLFTDTNLTTIVDDVDQVGPCRHNGTAWNIYYEFIVTEAFAVLDIPYLGGIVQIAARVRGTVMSGTFSYRADTNQIVPLSVGTEVETLDNTQLTGTTGTAGKVTVSLFGGQLYIENRYYNDSFTVEFFGRNTY